MYTHIDLSRELQKVFEWKLQESMTHFLSYPLDEIIKIYLSEKYLQVPLTCVEFKVSLITTNSSTNTPENYNT